MFNLKGSEVIFLLLIALVVLGPEKLPDAIRKFGRLYGEFRKIANGFQGELRNALDEPMREIRGTADALRQAAQLDLNVPLNTPLASGATNGDSAQAASTAATGDSVGAPPLVPDSAAPESPAPAAPAGIGLDFGGAGLRRRNANGESAEPVVNSGSDESEYL